MNDIVTTYVETFNTKGVEAAEAYLVEQGEAVTDEVKEAIKAAMAADTAEA